MTKVLKFTFFIFFPLIASGQYDFEKYPSIKYKVYDDWKTNETEEKVENSISISNFFKNGESLTIQLNSFQEHWFENSDIKIFKNNIETQNFTENIGFTPLALNSVRIADFNGDGLSDLKIIVPYMGNGIASMNVKVIYLFQQTNQRFLKVSFDDKQSDNRNERDFDGDGNYEIITMKLSSYQNHSYWNFNLFNLMKGKLINVNNKYDYPILVQFLEKENFKITDKISRKKMKNFALNLPEGYDIKQ
ncbi:hypothetical protein [Flavobacterium gilvum]|uniref:VCBS repeat-containing protein n=1 Tax=Flavobacterium gilvum TaxID=1492737 RepID=A0AAC9I737_9FLAO|nr:hypothetical protein [Flavobacterium gilvum]AOW09938.1 hypothetical protein EM308_10680 [Flavobacterium gilvum]KFC59603.1 hypothetical protein FEM08_15950 [Flavobacterium gilvum]